MKQSYYDLLGLSETASQDEIKKAYRKLARELHPDVNNNPKDQERFKEITNAYEILSDEKKRKEYDSYGRYTDNNRFNPNFNNDFFNVNDIFESIFGNQNVNRKKERKTQGRDALIDIAITLKEACFGVEKEIKIMNAKICDNCDGTGSKTKKKPQICKTCNGIGSFKETVRSNIGNMTVSRECRVCSGYGNIILDPCSLCKSNGRVVANEVILVKIPKGINDQQQIRLNMRGEVGNLGGTPGDLYIRVTVKNDEAFKRINNDLYTTISIPMTLAILGGEIMISSFDGEKLIKIPQGTQNKDIIKLENFGMYMLNKNTRGDLLVEINIKTPTKLSNEERLLIENFAILRKEENYIKNNKKSFTQNIKKKIKNEK